MSLRKLKVSLALVGALFIAAVAFAGRQDVTKDLDSYVGRKLILKAYGDKESLTVNGGNPGRPTGSCDKAVEIVKTTPGKDRIAFGLAHIGTVIGGGSRCASSLSASTLTVTELTTITVQTLAVSLREVLLTPEDYLALNGHPFEIPPSDEVETVTKLGGGVKAPTALLQVAPAFSEEARQKRIPSSRVAVEIVLGSDGRIHSSKVIRSPGYGLDEQALKVLSLWRFEPARQANKPVAVQLTMEMGFDLR